VQQVTEQKMKVEIYSDVACPWCYIGKRRFERALVAHPRADAVDVVFRPYQLDPSAPETAVPLRTHLVHEFGRSAEQMAAHVAAAARSVNTLAAHRLLRLAEREHGREVQHAVAERLLEAYFSAGLDVGDVEVLSALGAGAGMDAERVRAYLASDQGRAEVEAEIDGARRRGVTAVPTFVFDGRYRV
jgi:predicted DsbA family dithiol-disulfide isomerase